MRRTFLAVPTVVLSMTLAALAQTPTQSAATKTEEKLAEKSGVDKSRALEELLAKALQNSPDVQVAEARLREAEAALRQARLLVAQKTVELQQSMDQKQNTLSLIESRYKQAAQLRTAGTVSEGELNQIGVELANQKSLIAQLEAQVNMLVGRLPVVAALDRPRGGDVLIGRVEGTNLGLSGGSGRGNELPVRRMPHANMAAKLRGLLGTTIKINEQTSAPVLDLVEFIRKSTGAPILTAGLGENDSYRIDFKGEVTLAAYFQILADTANLNVYVRDYGFLMTQLAPPDDAISVSDFWQGEEKKSK